MWKIFFDGVSSWEGAGVGVLFVALGDEYYIPFYYRLQWDIDYTNNVCEYEASRFCFFLLINLGTLCERTKLCDMINTYPFNLFQVD